MKIKNVLSHSLAVVETEDYKTAVAIHPCDEKPQLAYLWKVELADSDPMKGVEHVFVLAQDSDGAVSQATCGRDVRSALSVEQVPFRIRGWGTNDF